MLSEPASVSETTTDESGNTGSVQSLLQRTLSYLDARLKLLKAEARGAASTGVVALAVLLLAFTAGAVAFAAVSGALVVWAARSWWHGDLLPAALSVAAIDLSIAIAAGYVAQRLIRRARFFQHSIQEIEEDLKWQQGQ